MLLAGITVYSPSYRTWASNRVFQHGSPHTLEIQHKFRFPKKYFWMPKKFEPSTKLPLSRSTSCFSPDIINNKFKFDLFVRHKQQPIDIRSHHIQIGLPTFVNNFSYAWCLCSKGFRIYRQFIWTHFNNSDDNWNSENITDDIINVLRAKNNGNNRSSIWIKNIYLLLAQCMDLSSCFCFRTNYEKVKNN